MTRFEEFCMRGFKTHGQKFVPPRGDEFIDAYNKGDTFRIKVQCDNWARWGYVGLTTGWRPCFLLMLRRGQHGSSDTLNPLMDKVINTKWLKEKRRK
jgi:hypothetical protein